MAMAGIYTLQTVTGVSVLVYSGQLVEFEAVAMGGRPGPDSPPAAAVWTAGDSSHRFDLSQLATTGVGDSAH